MTLKEKFKAFNKKFTKLTFLVYIVCFSLIIITLVGSLLSTIFADGTAQKLMEHTFLCLQALILINVPVLMQKFRFEIPRFLQIFITIFIVAHYILGEIYRVYDSVMLYDKMLHITSGVLIAMVGFSLVNLLNSSEDTHFDLSPFFVALFSFCFALAMGYLWEIIEYIVDSIYTTNMQRWKDTMPTLDTQGSGLIDTMNDLIVNAIGAFVICALGYIWLKRKNRIIDKMMISKKSKVKEELYGDTTIDITKA